MQIIFSGEEKNGRLIENPNKWIKGYKEVFHDFNVKISQQWIITNFYYLEKR